MGRAFWLAALLRLGVADPRRPRLAHALLLQRLVGLGLLDRRARFLSRHSCTSRVIRAKKTPMKKRAGCLEDPHLQALLNACEAVCRRRVELCQWALI